MSDWADDAAAKLFPCDCIFALKDILREDAGHFDECLVKHWPKIATALRQARREGLEMAKDAVEARKCQTTARGVASTLYVNGFQQGVTCGKETAMEAIRALMESYDVAP